MVKKYLTITLILAVITISIFALFFENISIKEILYIYENRNNFYTLEKKDVPERKILQKCNRLENCKLETGDILIRRYITPRIWLLAKLTNPHFTHSAIYIGDNKIIEAGGKEKDRSDDIRIIDINKSDWIRDDIDEIVVFRPTFDSQSKTAIIDSLKAIADDPKYYFGLHKFDPKRSTCAELIYDQLKSQNLVENAEYDDALTPDFLFSTLLKSKDKFLLIQE